MITANRYHDISVGHRVVGHEGKCRHLHGHNYRVHFEVTAPELDGVGRVLDFGVIKSALCMWLEDNWDHKFLAWKHDQLIAGLMQAAQQSNTIRESDYDFFIQSIIWVPFNPTAENMAQYLVEVVGPEALHGTGCELIKVTVEETRKCSCSYTKE